MKKLLCVIQRQGDRLGLIETLDETHQCQIIRIYPHDGEALPNQLSQYQAVIIGGGSMSVNDEHLMGIREQLNWIPKVLEQKLPVLGICLGGQLLAKVLGGNIAKNPQNRVDIGYVPIQPTDHGEQFFPANFHTYHWNQEGFEIPLSAAKLAAGQNFPNQAFCCGNAFGLQFHPEITLDMIQRWNQRSQHMLARPGAQLYDDQLEKHQRHQAAVGEWFSQFLTDHILKAV